MNTLVVELQEARAQSVSISEDTLTVRLVDGRTIQVPLAWYPRLWYGTPAEREQFELLGDGAYIHWTQLDEDLSVTGILLGKRSGESQQSLQKWLDSRATA